MERGLGGVGAESVSDTHVCLKRRSVIRDEAGNVGGEADSESLECHRKSLNVPWETMGSSHRALGRK